MQEAKGETYWGSTPQGQKQVWRLNIARNAVRKLNAKRLRINTELSAVTAQARLFMTWFLFADHTHGTSVWADGSKPRVRVVNMPASPTYDCHSYDCHSYPEGHEENPETLQSFSFTWHSIGGTEMLIFRRWDPARLYSLLFTYCTDRQPDSLVKTQPEYLIGATELFKRYLVGVWKSIKVECHICRPYSEYKLTQWGLSVLAPTSFSIFISHYLHC